jgi:hypothetical protein
VVVVVLGAGAGVGVVAGEGEGLVVLVGVVVVVVVVVSFAFSAPLKSPAASCFNAAGVVICEPEDLRRSIPAAAKKVPINDKINWLFGMSSGAVLACAAPKNIPASAPVMRAFPCFRGLNGSPLALKAIQELRKPPAIPAITEAITATVGSTNVMNILFVKC